MKNLLKLLGIIAIVALLGVSCASPCGDSCWNKDGNNGQGECTTSCGDPFPNCDC